MRPTPPEAWSSMRADPALAVAGLGGAGSDAVRDLVELDLPGLKTFAINTDARHLETMDVPERVLIGARDLHGRGSGGDRRAALNAAEDSQAEIIGRLSEYEIVFLLAGLGGGTGSALLPYVTKALRRTSTLAVPVAFLPFHHELSSPARRANAEESLAELEAMGGLVLALSNEKLLRYAQLPLSRVLRIRNAYVYGLIGGLIDMVERPSQMNLDLASVKTHLSSSGLSTLIWAERHVSEPERLVEEALGSTLLDFELGDRPSALVHLDGGSNLTLETLERVLTGLRRRLSEPRDMMVGTRTRDEPRDVVRLTAVVGGLRPQSMRSALG